MLISFRTMAYAQANIFLSAPYQTPKDELFQQATSFQESLEEELKIHYATNDINRHPDYRAELQSLLSTYYKELLGIAGASGVKAPRPLALARTPKQPPTLDGPRAGGPRAGGPRAGGPRAGAPPGGGGRGGGGLAAATLAKPAVRGARWRTSGN